MSLNNDRRAEALRAVKRNGCNLKNYPEFWDDDEIVGIAVENDPLIVEPVFSYASDRLKNDPEMVFRAVRAAGLALEVANERFKNWDKYIELAVSQEPAAILCASEEKQNDLEFLRRLHGDFPKVLKYIKNKEIKAEIQKEQNEQKKKASNR